VDIYVGEPGNVGRVVKVAEDGMRMWIRLTSGETARIDSYSDPLTFAVGSVVLVRAGDDHLEEAPDEIWPTDADERPVADPSWVGVVKLRTDDMTIVDTLGTWRRVPTSAVPYEVGNTVEGRDSMGVTAVLDRTPLRYQDPPGLDANVVERFRRDPSRALTFDDFGGLPAVIDRARELIELPLARGDKLREIGAAPIKGVLFTGLPGTGKTMLARIIASVAGATFYEISGPTIFSKWYGESEEILRRIFDDARAHSPSIVFFDEIDSVAGQRKAEAHEASKRVVAQLLTLMDGFSPDANVTVIAATNRPQDIDVALRRPGRFDWEIEFPLPTLVDRQEILRISGNHLVTRGPLPHDWVAANTDGWSAAELATIWREAALLAVADDRAAIMMEDYVGAHERVAAQRRRVMAKAEARGP
jgi:transitional endoplasmic reticulum ATPase